MFEWSDEHQMMRQAVRQFIEKEIVPDIDAYEHEGRPPYDALRKMFSTFGIDAAARAGFARRLAREDAAGGKTGAADDADEEESGGRGDPAMTLIPTIELSRHCPGMVTALGVSMGL